MLSGQAKQVSYVAPVRRPKHQETWAIRGHEEMAATGRDGQVARVEGQVVIAACIQVHGREDLLGSSGSVVHMIEIWS